MRKNKKVAKLLLRVMELNAKAPKDVYYNLAFSGHTNQVDFVKHDRNTYTVLKTATAYLDKGEICYTLSYLERAVESEEKLCKSMTNT